MPFIFKRVDLMLQQLELSACNGPMSTLTKLSQSMLNTLKQKASGQKIIQSQKITMLSRLFYVCINTVSTLGCSFPVSLSPRLKNSYLIVDISQSLPFLEKDSTVTSKNIYRFCHIVCMLLVFFSLLFKKNPLISYFTCLLSQSAHRKYPKCSDFVRSKSKKRNKKQNCFCPKVCSLPVST